MGSPSTGRNAPAVADRRLPEQDLRFVVEHARDAWESLRGGRLFLTGGTGFIGTWLLESFVQANRDLGLGASVEVLSRDPAGFLTRRPHLREESAVSFVLGDVRCFEVRGREFTHVIHGATTSGGPVPPQEMFSVIVDGTKRVLDACRLAKPARGLLISSGAVYGQQPSTLSHVSEDYKGGPLTTSPSSAYGEGKRAAELLVSIASEYDAIPFSIARCFAFVGPLLPLDKHFAIGNFIADVLAHRPIRVGGDGTPRRSYLYAADLVVWLVTILAHGRAARAYNVGGEQDVSILELAATVARRGVQLRTGDTLRVEIAKPNQEELCQPPNRYVPRCWRAADELRLSQNISLEEAIDRTLRFHEAALA
jgi:nucleoside-diphosphate-sugar epimerase